MKTFCRRVEVAKDRVAGWPAERLTVLAEHSSVFYDLMSDGVLEQARGPCRPERMRPRCASTAADRRGGRRCLCGGRTRRRGTGCAICTSPPRTRASTRRRAERCSAGRPAARGAHAPAYVSARQVLRFSFTLPPRERMAELGTVFAAAMHFIDAVGAYKLKPEQRLRAEKARKEAAAVQWRKQDDRRREEAEERRNAKRRDEAVRGVCRSVWREVVCVADRLP